MVSVEQSKSSSREELIHPGGERQVAKECRARTVAFAG